MVSAEVRKRLCDLAIRNAQLQQAYDNLHVDTPLARPTWVHETYTALQAEIDANEAEMERITTHG